MNENQTVDLNAIVDGLLDLLADMSPHRYAYPRSTFGQFPAFCLTLDFDAEEPVEYDVTIGHGWTTYHLQLIMVFGKGTDDEAPYRRMNQFLSYPGPDSVKERLESGDPTLGGACRSFIVGNGSKWGTQEFAGGLFLGGRFLIDVTA